MNPILKADAAIKRIVDTVEQSPAGAAPFVFVLGAGFSAGLVPTVKELVELHLPAWMEATKARSSRSIAEEYRVLLESTCAGKAGVEHAGKFWKEFLKLNGEMLGEIKKEGDDLRFALSDANLPVNGPDRATAYKVAFDSRLRGALGERRSAREFQRAIMRTDARRLNCAHFYLASVMGELGKLEDVPSGAMSRFREGVALSRLILTTNFDPFLQIALQMAGQLYYVTDRPELGLDDLELARDLATAVHLVYVHGSVHRPIQVAAGRDIARVRNANATALSQRLQNHGVIVLGYSGWDDVIVEALTQCDHFDHSLYWCGREPEPRPNAFGPGVPGILDREEAFYVPIDDAGNFMFSMCQELVRIPRLLRAPITQLLDMLDSIGGNVPNTCGSACDAHEEGPAPAIPVTVTHASATQLIPVRSALERAQRCFREGMLLSMKSDSAGAPTNISTAPPRAVQGEDQVVESVEGLANAIAGNASSIRIRPGVYETRIVISRPVKLTGDDGVELRSTNHSALELRTSRAEVFNLRLTSTGNNQAAIQVYEGQPLLENCRVRSDSGAGVEIHGKANPTLRSCRIQDCGLSGVQVLQNGHCTLEGNEVSHNRQHGICLEVNSEAVMSKNQISSNGWVGLFIKGGGTIEQNDISGSGGEGVIIQGPGARPTLRKNAVYENIKAGVLIQFQGGGVLEDNNIRYNRQSGVAITHDADPIVKNNRINWNNGKGVWCAVPAAGRVEGNDLTRNSFGARWPAKASDLPSLKTSFINNTE